MKGAYDFDLIVIGAGIAGMVSAVTAASLGKRVAVVEKSKVGGNCTNTTCIPSKALIRLGHARREMAHLERLGLLRLHDKGLESSRIMPRIREIVRTAYEKDLPETFERIGIRMIQAQATFLDPHRIGAGAETLSARKFIIAAGTIPLIPEIPGLSGIDYLTNETLYRLETLPRSLLILGGGVDGLEYASAFGRLGVETTVVEMAPRLLPMADGELVGRLLEVLRADGIRLLTGTKAVEVAGRQGRAALAVERQGGGREEIEAERVLVAVGRTPDLAGLALERAGVAFNTRASSRTAGCAPRLPTSGPAAMSRGPTSWPRRPRPTGSWRPPTPACPSSAASITATTSPSSSPSRPWPGWASRSMRRGTSTGAPCASTAYPTRRCAARTSTARGRGWPSFSATAAAASPVRTSWARPRPRSSTRRPSSGPCESPCTRSRP